MPIEHRYDDPQTLAAALATSIANDLRAALAERNEASLVLSGGRTPALLLSRLSEQVLDWARVGVTLADERWVEADHPDSNAALVQRELLQRQAARAQFVPLKNSAATPSAGESACAAALRRLAQPFDVVVLGMGNDGHTASLFPQAPQLPMALALDSGRICLGIDPVTASHPRMTLTLPALLASRRLIVFFSGADKWAVYQEALRPGPVTALPVRAVLHQHAVPVEIYYHA